MFLQDVWSYAKHINFIHPEEPTTGRVLTLLSSVRVRAIIVMSEKKVIGRWWSTWTIPGGHNVVERQVVQGFPVIAVDHSPRSGF